MESWLAENQGWHDGGFEEEFGVPQINAAG